MGLARTFRFSQIALTSGDRSSPVGQPSKGARRPALTGASGPNGSETPAGAPWVAMPTIDAAHTFALDVSRVKDKAGLADLLQEACRMMGCSWFALSHHIDFLVAPERGVRVHNYPEEWAHWFDEQRLGVTDPVHRESQRNMSGFLWHNMKTERPEDPR